MFLSLKNLKHYLIITLLVVATVHAIAQDMPPKKVYTPKERQIEEDRIHKDIEESLERGTYYPEALDEVGDSNRWLFSRINQSILLRQSTGERFGIYESFSDKNNTKRFEIRFHKNSKITARFLSHFNHYFTQSLSVIKVTANYVLYSNNCSNKDRPSFDTVYLHHYASGELYRLNSGESRGYKDPTLVLKNSIYKFLWDLNKDGNDKDLVIVKNFKIYKDKNQKWKAEELPPVTDEWDVIEPARKLPLKAEYNLPDSIQEWGKK